MSNEKNKNIVRLVPGEPVPQFGGMTPEQLGEFAAQIESIVLGTLRSADGAITVYSHLACRLFLDVEQVAGTEAMEFAIKTFNAALRDEITLQRQVRARMRERDAMTNTGGELH